MSVCELCGDCGFDQRLCDKCMDVESKRCLTEFEKFININGREDWDLEKMFEAEQKKINKKKLARKKVFITIALEGGSSKYNVTKDMMLTFASRIKYLYEDFNGVLECGKHKTKPNYHIHFIARIKNSKKHKSKLNLEWEKIFGDIKLDVKSGNYKINQHNDSPDMPPYDDWLWEKTLYLMNEEKGSHRNFDKSIPL